MYRVLFVNCSCVPFLDLFLARRKPWETRTRNMLRALVGTNVMLAETGNGRPLVRASAFIGEPLVIRSREEWEKYRERCGIPSGSQYDWKPWTKQKYLYPITDVKACAPFRAPEGVRHGRVWMECE